jgi:hypothetical protein
VRAPARTPPAGHEKAAGPVRLRRLSEAALRAAPSGVQRAMARLVMARVAGAAGALARAAAKSITTRMGSWSDER